MSTLRNGWIAAAVILCTVAGAVRAGDSQAATSGSDAGAQGGPSGYVPGNFIQGYLPATDQGRGQFFFIDKFPSPAAQSWKIEVRRVDPSTVFVHKFIINLPGGPPPGYLNRNTQFDLPRIDPGIPSSYEIDMMARVRVYSGLDATGTELYFSGFLYIIHGSTATLTPFTPGIFAPPTVSGPQLVPCVDLRPTGQNLNYRYNLMQRIQDGPQFQLFSFGHGHPGPAQTAFVQPPTLVEPWSDLQPGDSILWLRSRRNYHLNNGVLMGAFEVSPKSPNLNIEDLPAPAP